MLLKCFDRQRKNTLFCPLSLYIRSSAFPSSYIEAQQLSSNFKRSAKLISLFIGIGRERETPQVTFTGLLQFISNTESNAFNLLTQLLIQVQILTLMNDAITVKR